MTPDEQGIRDLITQLEAAWNAGNSSTYAELFSEDATFIQIYGGQLDGRAAIEASHRSIFDTIYKGSRASFTVRNIRLVRPDVAIMLTKARLDYFEKGENRQMETRPTFFLAKQKQRWQIIAFQNTRVSEMPAAAEGARRVAN